jgi:cell division protein FtsW (lipid II flippase)
VICGFLTSIGIALVGVAGFEPAASTSQMWRDTGLRYTPNWFAKVAFKIIGANVFSIKFKETLQPQE